MNDSRMARAAAVVLAGGVVLSGVLIAFGWARSLISGWTLSSGPGAPIVSGTDFSGLLPRVFELEPLGLVQAGLLVLVATPVVRVAVSAIAFWREGDRLYLALTLIVLALLLVSLGLLR